MYATVARPLSRMTTWLIAPKRMSFFNRSVDNMPEANGNRPVPRNKLKGARCVSTSPFPNDIRPPGNPEPPLGASGSFLDVRIPPPEVDSKPPIQVPYVPDFWDSVKLTPGVSLTEVPKVVVVGGTETSHGSARPQSVEEINMPLESDSTQIERIERSDSFLDDVAEDLYLPPVQEIKNTFRKIFS